MHVVELEFNSTSGKPVTMDAHDAIWNVIWALERNGQLVPDANRPDYETDLGRRIVAFMPESTSLRPKRHSPTVQESIADLREAGVAAPRCRVLGPSPDSRPVCTCASSSAMLLITDFLECEMPTRCGDCNGVVPFYRFPHTEKDGTYGDILYWTELYRGFDSIWISSGAGERSAYAQLSHHDSELSWLGRAVCRAIGRRAGVPVYYYLNRYYGRSVAAERRRRCPSCGGAWLLKEPWLGIFDFRCGRCRLVSHMGSDVG